jgi:hypothetical protein
MRRAVGDDFRLPYWDWTADAGDPELSAVWDPEVVGGDGDPVSSGPFQVGAITGRRWEVRLEADPLDGSLKRTGRGLRRSFGAVHLSIPSAEMVREAVSTLETYDTFPWDQRSTASFRQTLEGAINDSVPPRQHRQDLAGVAGVPYPVELRAERLGTRLPRIPPSQRPPPQLLRETRDSEHAPRPGLPLPLRHSGPLGHTEPSRVAVFSP